MVRTTTLHVACCTWQLSHGRSEVFVGRVLRDAIDQGIVKRDEVVVVTKLGHTAAPASAQARDTPPLRTLDSMPHGTTCNVQRRTA